MMKAFFALDENRLILMVEGITFTLSEVCDRKYLVNLNFCLIYAWTKQFWSCFQQNYLKNTTLKYFYGIFLTVYITQGIISPIFLKNCDRDPDRHLKSDRRSRSRSRLHDFRSFQRSFYILIWSKHLGFFSYTILIPLILLILANLFQNYYYRKVISIFLGKFPQ